MFNKTIQSPYVMEAIFRSKKSKPSSFTEALVAVLSEWIHKDPKEITVDGSEIPFPTTWNV